MWHAPQGLHAFLRAYYHAKSADWAGNQPHPLAGEHADGVRAAAALLRDGPGQGHGRAGRRRHAHRRRDRRLPLAARRASWRSTPRVRAHRLPGRAAVVSLSAAAASHVGGAAALRRPHHRRAGRLHLGQDRLGRVPARRQSSRRCRTRPAPTFRGAQLVDGAGHWVQQEQPEAVAQALLAFLAAA